MRNRLEELLKELKHNQEINLENNYENRVNIDYIIERIEYALEKNIRENWGYYRLNFDIYKVEVGVLLDKDNKEYDLYLYYDKKHSYYEENSILFLDYNRAVEYAKKYVDNGVNGTYSIISKLEYNSEKIYGKKVTDIEMGYVMNDINYILGNGYVEDIGIFDGLYELDNVIYSLYKVRDEKNPYFLGKGNGEIIENFVKTKEELVVEFMFDNNYINASEYDHWFENDIISIDQKIVCLYLTLEEMRKLHLAVEEEKKLEKDITEILVKYEKINRKQR